MTCFDDDEPSCVSDGSGAGGVDQPVVVRSAAASVGGDAAPVAATGVSPAAGQSGLLPVDLPRIERAVREILAAVGENPDRDGLLETPSRVARMYAELFSGLRTAPGRHLQKSFAEQFDELVLVRDISFSSMCEHHLLPFIGVAHIGYLPRGRVVGLSKLARVVEEVSRRPQVQERMTHQIADLLQQELDPKGAIVVIEASHSCMTIRGIRKPGSVTITSAVRGLFKTNTSSRAEVMAFIQAPRTTMPR
jgi:GTP cyclohydrolase IA